MKRTILVLGIACATAVAVAQSSAQQDQSSQANAPATRDQATGMASGKRMHKPMVMMNATDSSSQAAAQEGVHTARETGSGMATGRMAADGAQNQQKNGMSAAQSNPMYKDSATSGTNPLYQGNARATKTRSNIQNNRVATGDVDGDGTADATVVKSKSNITNNRKAPDVKNDGTAREAGSGMATGKRQ